MRLQKTEKHCPECHTPMVLSMEYEVAPHFVAIINHEIKIIVDNEIVLPGIDIRYRLCGIVYYANYHFVCRVVDKSGGIWYHDGQNNNNQVLYYGNIVNFSTKQLQSVGAFQMRMLLYTDYF